MELAISPQASRYKFTPTIKTGLAAPSILLVESNLESQQAHLQLLKRLSCNVDVASTGKEAIALSNHAYDLILLDTNLPDLCSFEVSLIIKAKHNPIRIPIIALSPHDLPAKRETIDDFLPKPLNPEKLISVLVKWV